MTLRKKLQKSNSKLFSNKLIKKAITIYDYWLSPSPDRPMMDFIKKNYKKNDLVGVEIGTYEGSNAHNMLRTNQKIKMLYLVDPYEIYAKYKNDADPITSMGSSHIEDVFIKAQNKLKKYEERLFFIRKYSNDAVNDIPEKIDFIYIDGNHSYDFVKQDIDLFFNKVKDGGVIGGHDYDESFPGVIKAAKEFSKKHNYKLYQSEYDWWCVKN